MFETPLITSFNVAQKKIKSRNDKMGRTETGATGKRKIQLKYGWVENSTAVSLKITVINRWYFSYCLGNTTNE